ncbi:MAG: hypothetical protein V8S28_06320 [Lachnospiraceae bacterium]
MALESEADFARKYVISCWKKKSGKYLLSLTSLITIPHLHHCDAICNYNCVFTKIS